MLMFYECVEINKEVIEIVPIGPKVLLVQLSCAAVVKKSQILAVFPCFQRQKLKKK